MSALLTGTARLGTNNIAKASIKNVAKQMQNAPDLFSSLVSAKNYSKSNPIQNTTRLFSSVGIVDASFPKSFRSFVLSQAFTVIMAGTPSLVELNKSNIPKLNKSLSTPTPQAKVAMEQSDATISGFNPSMKSFLKKENIPEETKLKDINSNQATKILDQYLNDIVSYFPDYQNLEPQEIKEVKNNIDNAFAIYQNNCDEDSKVDIFKVVTSFNGIDFKKPVSLVEIRPGEELCKVTKDSLVLGANYKIYPGQFFAKFDSKKESITDIKASEFNVTSNEKNIGTFKLNSMVNKKDSEKDILKVLQSTVRKLPDTFSELNSVMAGLSENQIQLIILNQRTLTITGKESPTTQEIQTQNENSSPSLTYVTDVYREEEKNRVLNLMNEPYNINSPKFGGS